MLEEGIEHSAVYMDERLAFERPGWKYLCDVPGCIKEPRNPNEQAFEKLDAARASDPDAKLAWYYENHVHNECDPYEDCPKYDKTCYVAVSEFLGSYVVFGL